MANNKNKNIILLVLYMLKIKLKYINLCTLSQKSEFLRREAHVSVTQ